MKAHVDNTIKEEQKDSQAKGKSSNGNQKRDFDANGLPAAGDSSRAYIVCPKCKAWYCGYGLTSAYCSCSCRFSKQSLEVGVKAGEVQR